MANVVVTGGAGFIGNHLVRALVKLGNAVRVVDDFSTGRRQNLADVARDIEIHEVSICDMARLAPVFENVDVCYHQAALASVARSVVDPVLTNHINVSGTLNVFMACRDAAVRRVVYASSSSVYGNAREMPLHEGIPTQPISPYAASKAADELYANTFGDLYGLEFVGLRYFNVFGPLQDPNSPYSAAIPIFITRMLQGQTPIIFGTGKQSRDFVYVDNIVMANIQAGYHEGTLSGVFNIGSEYAMSLLEMVKHLNQIMNTTLEPEFGPPRPGDVDISLADISSAREAFGYTPLVDTEEGLRRTVTWYAENKM